MKLKFCKVDSQPGKCGDVQSVTTPARRVSASIRRPHPQWNYPYCLAHRRPTIGSRLAQRLSFSTAPPGAMLPLNPVPARAQGGAV